jgi:hypothetical protein
MFDSVTPRERFADMDAFFIPMFNSVTPRERFADMDADRRQTRNSHADRAHLQYH